MQQHQQHHQPPQSSSDILHGDLNHRQAISEAMRAQQGFSPFEQQSRPGFPPDDPRDMLNHGQHNVDALRRSAVASPADRVPYSTTSDAGSNYSNPIGGGHISANSDSFSVNGSGPPFDPISNGSQFSVGKGSRFLKYFEEKGREGQPGGIRKPSGPVGYQSSSPIPGQRQDQSGFNGLSGQVDNRTVDDLFAMLNTPNQVCLSYCHVPAYNANRIHFRASGLMASTSWVPA